MDYTKYKKRVIVLKEQNKDFALGKESGVTGYVKLEIGENRGAVRVGAENLKESDKQQYIYKAIMFGKYKEKNIYKVLGSLPIDSSGTGESYFHFDPKNVDGNGNPLERFSVILLVAVSQADMKEPLHPVLRGSFSMEDEQTPEKAKKHYNDYYNEYILSGCKAVADRIDMFDRIVPFREDKTCAEWKRISNTGRFPVISPDTQRILARYRHFIFGIGKHDYFLGVPGRYLEKEHPEGGRSGFTLWQPIVGAEHLHAAEKSASLSNRQAAYGYWIMKIDKKTGIIEEI